MYVDLDTPTLNRAFLCRSVHGGSFFGLWYRLTSSDENQPTAEDARQFATRARKGRLRLVRADAVISYYAAEEVSDTFKLLFEHPIGRQDVRTVRLGGTTGGTRASLDFRVTDLRIHAQGFIDLPEPPAGAGSAPGGGWLFLALALVAVLAAPLAVILWRSARRRQLVHAAPGPVQVQEQAKDAAAPTAFACSNCGKPLKVRTALLGKKVRCPHCQQLVRVPDDPGVKASQP
jgi:hypothetical protein